MTEEQWRRQLIDEGFKEIWTHTDEPNREYEEHSHPVDTTHVVLAGSMAVKINGSAQELRTGERLDIAKHVLHSAAIGSQGCTFLMGAKV